MWLTFNTAATEAMEALNKGNKDSALQIVNNDAQIANESVLVTALKINEYQEGN